MGALNLDKCYENGMISVEMVSRLKQGENVVTLDGKTIIADEVCLPNEPGPVVLGRFRQRLGSFAVEKCEAHLFFLIQQNSY